MIVFTYKEEQLAQGSILRPVAEVFLKTNSNKWIEFHPYIDSGADITMIPLSVGKLLGIDLDKTKVEQIGGIRGSGPVVYTKRVMKIGSEEFPVHIAWALTEDVPPLLGRTDVFDMFTVTFRQHEKKIIFDKR